MGPKVRCAAAQSVVVKGGNGNDNITVDAGSAKVKIIGGPGKDVLTSSGSGRANLVGKGGNDTLHGGTGIDTLNGGPGNDMIYSADGNAETVLCGPGSDQLFADSNDGGVGCETISRS